VTRFARLQPYPFERLTELKTGISPPQSLKHIALSIGEPQHPIPSFILETLSSRLADLGRYPTTVGMPMLREACARWLVRRFALPGGSVHPEAMVLPVNGTREALFAFAQAMIEPGEHALVVMPNPFYQIYEGAALLAGAEPYFLNTSARTDFLPDLDAVPAVIWERCRLLYLCSPGNPTGAVMPLPQLQRAVELAQRYDFIVAADECYAELYRDDAAAPASLLNASLASGSRDFRRCVVFHSLSKRSSVPGLRSGFVAGDPELLKRFLLYRTYHGCAMPVPTQFASAAAWNDDAHASSNRALYREKYRAVLPILSAVLALSEPDGGFYLWPEVGTNDEHFTRELFRQQHLTVLPGRYLARDAHGENPGIGRVRISLVPPLTDCVEAANRIRRFIEESRP